MVLVSDSPRSLLMPHLTQMAPQKIAVETVQHAGMRAQLGLSRGWAQRIIMKPEKRPSIFHGVRKNLPVNSQSFPMWAAQSAGFASRPAPMDSKIPKPGIKRAKGPASLQPPARQAYPGYCPNGNPFERSLKPFCQQILVRPKICDVNC